MCLSEHEGFRKTNQAQGEALCHYTAMICVTVAPHLHPQTLHRHLRPWDRSKLTTGRNTSWVNVIKQFWATLDFKICQVLKRHNQCAMCLLLLLRGLSGVPQARHWSRESVPAEFLRPNNLSHRCWAAQLELSKRSILYPFWTFQNFDLIIDIPILPQVQSVFWCGNQAKIKHHYISMINLTQTQLRGTTG